MRNQNYAKQSIGGSNTTLETENHNAQAKLLMDFTLIIIE
jgi:hypothetical protein